MNEKTEFNQLFTPFENNSDRSLEEYPHPQMKRKSYLSLCGQWDLSVLKNGTKTPLGKITVPYPPESRISGQLTALLK